ncbi:MAG: amidohydrolase family protein, partial [Planctomycetes bacterium]|nr:amidohydrolase family protein [Planctomycetota bacterium]
GYEQAEDFISGSQAALRAGVTTILDMPNNSPAITTIEKLQEKRESARKSMLVNYGFYLAATNTNLDEIMNAEHIAGVKLFYGSTTGDILVDDKYAISELFKNSPHKIIVHAEDEQLIQRNAAKYKHETKPELHYKIRTKEAALTAIRKIIELTEKFNTNTHIAHLSSPEEVELVKNTTLTGKPAFKFQHRQKDSRVTHPIDSDVNLKQQGCTGEIAIPHLFFNIDDYATKGNLIKCNPSVKCTASEVEKLWEFLREIKNLQIVTDHAPHPLADKTIVNYWQAKAGIPSIENAPRLLLNAALQSSIIDFTDIARLYSYNPSKNFNILKRGEIREGYFADFAVVNPSKTHEILNEHQISRCCWTPFHKRTIQCDIEMTILNGTICYENGTFFIEDAQKNTLEIC